MSRTLDTTLPVVEMEIEYGPRVFMPLFIPNTIRIGGSSTAMAQAFKAASRLLLEKGQNLEVSRYLPSLEVNSETLEFLLKLKANPGESTELNFSFDYFYVQVEEQFLGFLPPLGLECVGESQEELKENLIKTIRLEFARRRREKNFLDLLAAFWWKSQKVSHAPLKLTFYNPDEAAKEEGPKKKSLLSQATDPVRETERVFGLNKEQKELARSLRGSMGRSTLLVGKSGSGKTALVQSVFGERKSMELSNLKMRETSAARLIRRLTDERGWQLNLSKLCRELHEEKTVLFVRNLSDLFETGHYVGNDVSLAEYLREYIESGEITLITECTEEELARLETVAPGYTALFNNIQLVDAPLPELEKSCLLKIEHLSGPRVRDVQKEAITETLLLQKRFMPYSGFPGKTIRFLEALMQEGEPDGEAVDRKLVIKRFCEETGMPEFMISSDVPLDRHKLLKQFRGEVFGQEEAVDIVVDVLLAVKTALNRRDKPIASLLFVGPTGVGKTELAKLTANFMFGSRDRMIRLDMSEYSDFGSVLRLIGESYGQEGVLTSLVRREPFSVVLFDELEKAHPSFYDFLLQILGEGRLTDSQGRTTDFCSTIIIMTSNIGAESYGVATPGFHKEQNVKKDSLEHFAREVRTFFRPELFNRLDQVAPFSALTRENLRMVVRRELTRIQNRSGIKNRRLELNFQDEALDQIALNGYDARYGARKLQRALQTDLLAPLSRKLNGYDFKMPLKIDVKIEAGEIQLDVRSDEEKNKEFRERETSTLSTANKISILRRETGLVVEGDFYIRLVNELTHLEKSKLTLGDKFWRKIKHPERLDIFASLRYQLLECFSAIQELEANAVLNYMSVGSDDLLEQFESWLTDYLDLGLQLYHQMEPNSDGITLGVYGSREQLKIPLNLYKALAAKRGLHWEARVVWRRNLDKAPPEEEEPVAEKDDEDEDEEEVQKKEEKKDFQIIETEFVDKFEPILKGDLLVGIIMRFSGPGAWLYLREEAGVHTFLDDNEKKFKFLFLIHQTVYKNFPTPDNPHRKTLFDGTSSRRTCGPGEFQDDKYNMRLSTSGDVLERLFKVLENRFSKKLRITLLNAEGEDDE